MNEKPDQTLTLQGDTLDLALLSLYGDDAGVKVKRVYDMLNAKITETERLGFNRGLEAGAVDKRALERERDALTARVALLENRNAKTLEAAKIMHAQGLACQPAVSQVSPFSHSWTPAPPTNIDPAELDRLMRGDVG